MLSEGGASNIGRRGFEAALIHFDGTTLTADTPAWATTSTTSLAVAVGPGRRRRPGRPGWQSRPTAASAWADRRDLAGVSVPGKNSFKPSLAISGQTIFVGWHAENPTAASGPTTPSATTTARPSCRPRWSRQRWYPNSAPQINGVGLRENADFPDGIVYYAYGDARSGTAVYMAQIRP